VEDGFHVVDRLTRDQVAEWLRHPVTKVIGLLLLAEIARQVILARGGRVLGLVPDAAGEV
jgi:hypothetical protein